MYLNFHITLGIKGILIIFYLLVEVLGFLQIEPDKSWQLLKVARFSCRAEMLYFIFKIILDNKQNFNEIIKLTMILPFINSEILIDRSV